MSKNPTRFEDLQPFSHLEVRVRGDSDADFDIAMKRWKSAVQRSRILSVYKEKTAYEKPSDRRRRKKRESLDRLRASKMRENQMASGEWEERQKRKTRKKEERIRKIEEKRSRSRRDR